MSLESIQTALRQRFSAPLPEFCRRRIIFWSDEAREFDTLPEELDLPGVGIVRLTGSNNFAVKKLLLHDDPDGDYLIYNPLPRERAEENWLRDLELCSEEYRADLVSEQMRELHLPETPAMRKTVKRYGRFLGNKERLQKLRKIGREYQTPLQLQLDILAVLAGLNGGSAQDVFIAVLSAGWEEEHNAVFNSICRFGDPEDFWQLVHRCTGYHHEETGTLRRFAAHVLLTALAQTADRRLLRGLEDLVSESCTAFCYSMVRQWREQGDRRALWELCRGVEQELRLHERLERQDTEALLTADLFPAIHEVLLERFFSEIAAQVVKTELILKTVENRRTAAWQERFADCYDCLYSLARMQQFYQEHTAGFHMAEPAAVWKCYTEQLYEMDSHYRRFHLAFGAALRDSNPRLEDGLKHAADYVEGLYSNWYLQELNGCWTNAAGEDLTARGSVPGIGRQRDFYARYVQPLAGKGIRTFVIISDALRYETAAELCGRLAGTTRGSARLESMQAVFPSVTKFGMAALLPGRALSLSEEMEVLVDGLPTRTAAEREKVLRAANEKSVAVQYKEVLGMKRAERRELVSGRDVVYIYHDIIDATGHKPATEQKVFEACGTAVQELLNLLRIVVNDMQGTDVFLTSDHGFLYTYSPLREGEKLTKAVIDGPVCEAGRRYALTPPSARAEFLLPVRMEELGGTPVRGFTPRDPTRLKTSGGENYVHGGISLQELAVPVIVYKNLRSGSRQYVEPSAARLQLLSESRKVSNRLFSLDFFQRQPVGDKVRPCAYTICMTDEEGVPVSDRQTVIADRTGENASQRVFRVRLSLRPRVYDSRQVYRLVIAGESGEIEEVEFQIDIPYGGDGEL